MKTINFKGLPKGITVQQLIELEKNLKKLPEGFKITYKKPKENYAEKLVEELKK